MNLTYLQTFLVVAEQASFTKAADQLEVSKGLVSRHIAALEQSLNSKLFHRTTRSINLTEAGQELLIKAKQIQLIAAEAQMRVKDLSQTLAGELKITAPPEFGRTLCEQVIPDFLAQYPEISLTLDLSISKREIVSGDFDIAFRAYQELPPDVVGRTLGYVRNVLVCGTAFYQQHKITELAQLHQANFVLNGQNTGWNQLNLVSQTARDNSYQIEVKGNINSTSYSSILALALNNLGIASLPFYQVAPYLNTGKLTQVLPNWSVKTHKLSLIYAKHKVTPEKIRLFNQAVEHWLAKNPEYLISHQN